MATEAFDPGTRIALLERENRELKARVDRNSHRLQTIETTSQVASVIATETRDDVSDIKKTVDRIVWAIIGLAFTIAGFIAQQAITPPH